MIFPSVPSRAIRLVLVAAAGCVGASATATATASAKSPSCKTIPGQTLAVSGGWRIVAATPPAGGRRSKVVACETKRRGPALVRMLGLADFNNGSFWVESSAGTRVIVAASDGGSSGGGSTQYRLIDLASGRSRELGASFWNTNPNFQALALALAPSGGFATATWEGSEGPGPGGPLQVVDGAGEHATPTLVRELAPSIGDGEVDAGGAYYLAGDGSIGRVEVTSPAVLSRDPALRLRATKLPARAKPSNVLRTTLAADGQRGSQIELVVRRGANADGTASVEFAGTSQGAVKLVDGVDPDLKVLAAGWRSVLVAAHFADRPDERRIRLLVAPNYPGPTVDLPATPAAEAAGHAAINARDNTVYLADGDRLYVRSTSGPALEVAIPGIHDLAVGPTGLAGVFYTDSLGVARAAKFVPSSEAP